MFAFSIHAVSQLFRNYHVHVSIQTRKIAISLAAISIAIILALLTKAEEYLTPTPGLWEITSSIEAASQISTPTADQRCMTAEQATQFDRFFTSPEPPSTSGPESCRMAGVEITPRASNWTVQCDSSMGEIFGVGSSSFSRDGYNASQIFSSATFLGRVRFMMKISARRVSECPADMLL